jgi:hypothetical protein
MGRRLAEMAHSLSAHLDGIDYEAQQEISSSPLARRAAIITEAHAKAEAVLAAFTADVAGVRAQAEKEVGRLAAGIMGRAPTDKSPTTQTLSNEPQHRGEKSGSSGQTTLHNAGDAPGGSRSGHGDPHVRGDISDVPDDPAVGGSPRGDPQLRGELQGDPIATAVPATPAPLPSPLSGGAGAPSAGGGLSSGLGGGTSFSGLTSGLGNLPGATTSPSGLSGGSATPGAVVDSSALSRAAAAEALRHGWSHRYLPLRRYPAERCTPPGAGSAAPPALPAGLASAGAHNPILRR